MLPNGTRLSCCQNEKEIDMNQTQLAYKKEFTEALDDIANEIDFPDIYQDRLRNIFERAQNANGSQLELLVRRQKLSWFTKRLIELKLQDLEERIRLHNSGESELIPEAVKDYENDIGILKEFLSA